MAAYTWVQPPSTPASSGTAVKGCEYMRWVLLHLHCAPAAKQCGRIDALLVVPDRVSGTHSLLSCSAAHPQFLHHMKLVSIKACQLGSADICSLVLRVPNSISFPPYLPQYSCCWWCRLLCPGYICVRLTLHPSFFAKAPEAAGQLVRWPFVSTLWLTAQYCLSSLIGNQSYRHHDLKFACKVCVVFWVYLHASNFSQEELQLAQLAIWISDA